MKFKLLIAALVIFQLYGCESYSRELKFTPLYVGFNGKEAPSGLFIYEEEAAIRKSWLKKALSPDDFDQLIKKVNFKNQFLMEYSFGERSNANGKIIVNSLTYRPDIPSLNSGVDIDVSIGVTNKELCNKISYVKSYPFIIVAVDRPKQKFKLKQIGDGVYNFPDGCAVPIASKPTEQ
jgi:hypothetical protein